MREIRFRIWDMDRKVMLDSQGVIFYYGDFYENYRDFEDGIVLDNIEVMQSTGLVDKHGVEIFEGDWVRVETQEEDNGEFPIGYVVRANDEPKMFIALPEQLKETSERQYHLESLYEHYSGEFEVIGNIYQNSGLLEG